jgi:hypothetical protein
LTPPSRLRRPIRIVKLRTDVSNIVWKLRGAEVEGWAGHHEYPDAPVIKLEYVVER